MKNPSSMNWDSSVNYVTDYSLYDWVLFPDIKIFLVTPLTGHEFNLAYNGY